MIPRSLGGNKIAVLVESEFIPEEIEAYQKRFSELKATVHLMSRLWGNPSVRFFSDEDTGKTPQTIEVNVDFQNVDVNDYAAVIMSANYLWGQPKLGDARCNDRAVIVGAAIALHPATSLPTQNETSEIPN